MQNQTEKKQIYKRVGIISLFTLLSRILGAIRDLVLLHVFGAGVVHDAYVVAQTIPNALRRLTAEGSMTLAVVPIYTDVREKVGQEAAQMFARRALGLVIFATLLITLLGIIFSSEIVTLFAAGFKDNTEKFQLTVLLTQIMFPYLIFVSIVAWAMAILNAEKLFAAPAAAPILLNVGIITGAVVFSTMTDPPIAAVAWGVIGGGVLQVFLQWPSLRSIKQSLIPANFFADEHVRKLLLLLAPSLFGVAVYEMNIIVLRNIASAFPDGQMTYYYASSRLTELVTGLFAFSFAAASFPELSKSSSNENWQHMYDTLKFAFSGAMFIIIPATLGLIFFAEAIVKMLYLHGKFTVEDANYTIDVLRMFAISIPALSLTRILLPAYYSLKDAKTPVVVAFFTLLVTGFSGYWLGQSYQVVGLGLGLSIGSWFQAICLLLLLKLKSNFNKGLLVYVDLIKYLFCAMIACSTAYFIGTWANWNKGAFILHNWIIFISGLISAALIYFVILHFTGDAHSHRLVSMIKRKAKL